ncbi:MAG TPA: PIN domain-containing protein [Solirubrobacteraceae bacterium]|nr:PIN domain-containing protein [Solirubrobacteraceae bacterium]
MADGRAFVDTNVFVYAFDNDEPAKRAAAIELLSSHQPGALVTSAQVLGEFYVTVTRKLRSPLTAEQALVEIARLAPLATIALDRRLVLEAAALAVEQPISYWDALIVRAAATAGCQSLLTEDLADGTTIAGVRIHDPFG